MSSTLGISTGRALQTLVGIMTIVGPYVADFNETHVYNPNWPPHARFHNGQTMSFGLTLGLLQTFFIWKPVFFTSSNSPLPSISAADSAVLAAIIGSLYWICGMSAILYPGSGWVDPEFRKGGPNTPDAKISPQARLFSGLLAAVWGGCWLTLDGLGFDAVGSQATPFSGWLAVGGFGLWLSVMGLGLLETASNARVKTS